MCTSFIVNKRKTIVGWNLDIANYEHRVRVADKGVFIEINDAKEGWMPLFGANSRGDFVGMPTCWPFDERSNPTEGSENIIILNIDMLLQKKTLQEIKAIANQGRVCSIPGFTFMSALSDCNGNMLHIIPGQGCLYYERPEYKILTNFSPFKQDNEKHPWMGWDRYQTADGILKKATNNFGVQDGFEVLKAVAQEECPTVVSMIFDVTEKKVYWCEDRNWDSIQVTNFSAK